MYEKKQAFHAKSNHSNCNNRFRNSTYNNSYTGFNPMRFNISDNGVVEMVRLFAKNVERKLQNSIKGYVKIHTTFERNDYTLIVDISNNSFHFRQLIRNTQELINSNITSQHLCNQILSKYKHEIHTTFFK